MSAPLVVCFHLLDDFSGSPRVLALAIAALRARGAVVHLCTSGGAAPGALATLDVVRREVPYRWSPARWATLARFARAQVRAFFVVLGYPRTAVVYVNTLLPAGAALAGWATGKRVVYHVHEASVRPRWLQRLLEAIARATAGRRIYVSRFLLERSDPGRGDRVCVYNALPPAFEQAAAVRPARVAPPSPFVVVMACSLKDYKGVPEFLALASRLEHRRDIRFRLVLNAASAEVERYFTERVQPPNVEVTVNVPDMRPVYEEAGLVVNLSRPDEWIETFGLTLLEAMAFGVPVIGPPVGGPVEIVDDGGSGFLVDGRDTARLEDLVQRLAGSPEPYARLSAEAKRRAGDFGHAAFSRRIVDAVLA